MPWARVHLESGRSSGDQWEVDASAAGARIDVGTASSCVWQVHAPGVAPRHLEMYWDGEVLWIAQLDAAGVRIDGQLVDDWYATAHGSRIELGQARMRVETSFAPSMADERPASPSPTGRTTVDRPELSDAATRIDGGMRGVLDGAPTRVTTGGDALDHMLERLTLPSHVDVQETTAESDDPTAGEPTRAAVFGGAAGLDPMATRLVQTPESRLGGGAGSPIHRRPPPPRIGAGSGVQRASAPAPLPNPHDAPKSAPPAPAPPARAAAAAPTPPAAPPPPTPSSTPPTEPGKPKFAAPPPLETHTAADDKRKGSKGGAKEMALPPRTWVLLGATVLALAYVILMDDGSTVEEEPPPAPVAIAPEAEPETDAEAEAEAETDAETVTAAETESEETGARPLVRRAVDALMAGRHREALALYAELRGRHPRNEAYEVVVGILEKRVAERCEEGAPCE